MNQSDIWIPKCTEGLGGQIIKNAKGHKKLRQRAQNSGKTQDRPEVSKEILLS